MVPVLGPVPQDMRETISTHSALIAIAFMFFITWEHIFVLLFHLQNHTYTKIYLDLQQNKKSEEEMASRSQSQKTNDDDAGAIKCQWLGREKAHGSVLQ